MGSDLKSKFGTKVSQTIQKAQSDIIHGAHPAHVSYEDGPLVGTGASIFLDQDHSKSIVPDTRNLVSLSPEATILVTLRYLAIPLATLFGYIIWNEIPSYNQIIGGLLVIGSCLLITYREFKKK